MGLGRHVMDDENSVLVQAARTVQLTDDVSIYCKSTQDADTLREHLASLSGHGLTEVSLGDGLSVYTAEPEVLTRVIDSLRDEIRDLKVAVLKAGRSLDKPVAASEPVKRGPGRPRKQV